MFESGRTQGRTQGPRTIREKNTPYDEADIPLHFKKVVDCT